VAPRQARRGDLLGWLVAAQRWQAIYAQAPVSVRLHLMHPSMDPSSEKNAPGRWVSSASHPPAWSFRSKRTSGRPSWPSTSWGQSYGPTHRSNHPDPCTNCIKVSRSGPRRLLPSCSVTLLRPSVIPYVCPGPACLPLRIPLLFSLLPRIFRVLSFPSSPRTTSVGLEPSIQTIQPHSRAAPSRLRLATGETPNRLRGPPSSNACARSPATFASIEATCNGATNIRNDRHAR